jgi:DNA polymerase-3 subunit delta
MIVKSGDADRYAARPPKSLVAALVFGPDQGLVRERADTLAKSVVPDLADPFRVAELDADALTGDPARLSDEAAAMSMLGGRRVVRLRNAGNAQAKLLEEFLDAPSGDALLVVEAGDLARSASLRKIFEEAENAAALPCYSDNAHDLEDLIRPALKAEGLSVAGDALALMVSRLGSDRGVTRRELEKLSLYAQGEKTITIAHVQAVMGDESELRMDEACDAAGEGDFARLDTALARLWQSGASPVGVLRNAMGHFHRILMVRSESEGGGDMAFALKKLRPPLHFSRANSFRAQVSRFTPARAQEALNFLYEAEALTKTTAVPAEAACGRALLSVAALARAGR